MNDRHDCIYGFGNFRLFVAKRKLLREGQVVPLQPRTFHILLLLIERNGHSISKEEIMATVWAGRIVEESNLTQHIYNLRRFLRDSGDNGGYIKTVPGGYLFKADVTEIDPATITESNLIALAPPPTPAQPETITPDQPCRVLANRVLAYRVLAYRVLVNRVLAGIPLHRQTIFLSLGLVIIISLALLSYYRLNSATTPSPRTGIFVALSGIENSPAYSPNGEMVVFTGYARNSDNGDLYLTNWLKNGGNGEPIRLTSDPRSEICPVWSPDNRQIAFLREADNSRQKYQLTIIPAEGGSERVIGSVWHGLDWSPDGEFLAVSDNQGPGMPTVIYLHSVNGNLRRAVTPEVAGEEIFENKARFSPDGRTIAFVRWRNDVTGDLHIVDLRTGKVDRLTFDEKSIFAVDWTPDGQEIIFVSNRNGSNRLWRISPDGGLPTLANDLDLEIESFSISPDGRTLLFTRQQDDQMIEISRIDNPSASAVNGQSGDLPCQIDSSRQDHSPRFSPNGQQIVFISDRTNWSELWIANNACRSPRQLTRFEGPGVVGSPRWSPDGTSIVFDRYADGQVDIFSIKADGTEQRQLTSNKFIDILPAWSQDGSWIYFNSMRAGHSNIWKMMGDGRTPTAVTNNGGWEGMESIDGRQLFYSKSDYLWQKDLASGDESIIPELAGIAVDRNWTVTAKSIFYIPKKFSGVNTLFRLDLTSRKIEPVTEVKGFIPRSIPILAVSPDETRMAIGSFSYRHGDILKVDDWLRQK